MHTLGKQLVLQSIRLAFVNFERTASACCLNFLWLARYPALVNIPSTLNSLLTLNSAPLLLQPSERRGRHVQ
jgi:hypothetical protein